MSGCICGSCRGLPVSEALLFFVGRVLYDAFKKTCAERLIALLENGSVCPIAGKRCPPCMCICVCVLCVCMCVAVWLCACVCVCVCMCVFVCIRATECVAHEHLEQFSCSCLYNCLCALNLYVCLHAFACVSFLCARSQCDAQCVARRLFGRDGGPPACGLNARRALPRV